MKIKNARLLLVISLLFIINFVSRAELFSQDPIPLIRINEVYNQRISGLAYSEFLPNSDNKVNIENVYQAKFTPIDNYPSVFYPEKSAWFKFVTINDSDSTFAQCFVYPKGLKYDFFQVKNGKTTSIPIINSNQSFVNSAPHEKSSFYLKVDSGKRSIGRFSFNIYEGENYLSLLKLENSKGLRFAFYSNSIYYFFIGFFFLFSLYNFAIYLQSKDVVFMYYAGYIFTFMIYILPKTQIIQLTFMHSEHFTYWQTLFNNTIQPIIYYFYFQFARHFLNTKIHYIQLDKLMIGIVKGSLIASVVIGICYFINYQIFDFIYNTYRIILIFLTIFVLDSFIKLRTKLNTYFIAGASIFFLFSLLAMFSSMYQELGIGVFMGVLYMAVGAAIEMLAFSLGLGYRFRLIEQEKLQTQKSLLRQSEKNEYLQIQLSEKLKDEVRIKTYESEQKQIQIEKIALEKKVIDLESNILRSQMNPHFLFNSLNSLKRYIMEKRDSEALEFIDQFSLLFRKVLNNSRENQITLKEEINALDLYVKLEIKRLNGSFDYVVIIDKSIDTEFLKVPPLFLQPFVENAIWHGIMNKTNGRGKILLKINENKDFIEFLIEDNGVGRIKAAKYDKSERADHNSLGTRLVNERLELLKNIKKTNITFEIEDKPNNGGTRVLIRQYHS